MSVVDWNTLMVNVHRLSDTYEGVVFIGGVAVYLHVLHSDLKEIHPETSHDIDLMFSLADFSDLRDNEQVTRNSRLEKHQLIRDGLEFDIYVEHNNSLAVSYQDTFTHSIVINKVRVACLEHLLVLKLHAYLNRKESSKGKKDFRDLVKLLLLLEHSILHKNLVIQYLTPDMDKVLSSIASSREVLQLAQNNAHLAKSIRSKLSSVISHLQR